MEVITLILITPVTGFSPDESIPIASQKEELMFITISIKAAGPPGFESNSKSVKHYSIIEVAGRRLLEP